MCLSWTRRHHAAAGYGGSERCATPSAPGSSCPLTCIAAVFASGSVVSGTLTDTAGGSGLQFDSSTGTYTYVWKTSKTWAGTCQRFDLRLNDGTDHTADFQFR